MASRGARPKSSKGSKVSLEKQDSSGSVRDVPKVVHGASPEIVYKMSKKIAQLTKVIYFLNTKNEDNSAAMQAMADDYQNEIQEIIDDGNAKLEDLTTKYEETQAKCDAQEEVIQSYLEKIAAFDSTVIELTESESKIRTAFNDLADQHKMMEATYRAQVDDLTNRVDVGKVDEELIAVRNHYEKKIREMKDDHESAITSINTRYVSEIDDLKLTHNKKMKQLTDEQQRNDENLKSTVAALKSRHDDEIRYQQQEQKRLKQALDEKDKEAKETFNAMQNKLMEQIRELKQSLLDRDARISEMGEDLLNKTSRLKELEQLIITEMSLRGQLETELLNASQALEVTQMELEATAKRLEKTAMQLSASETDCRDKTIQITKLTSSLTEAKEEIKGLSKELEATKASLAEAIANFNEAAEDLKYSKNRIIDLVNTIEENDKTIKEQSTAIINLQIKHERDMTTALSELRQELESKHSQIMTIRINQLESTHKALVDGKNDNIRMLESKIQHLKSLHAEELKKMMEQHDIERTKLTGSVRDLEAAVADISARLVSTEKSLEIKTADVEQHLLTIQGLNSTVRTLETDKADLFQKMLHIDEQTRTELEERYEREAVEWKEEWELKLQAALNSLRDELSLQHIKELDILRTKLETEKKEELNVYTQQMQALKDEFEEEARKFRTQIEKLEQEKEDMFKDVLQEQELRKEALEAAYQRFEEDLWRERTKWETEQQARETQLKVASTLALANIEKKHAAQIEELESLHNRQIEDLRNFHTISALAAKKEAETVRQDLIAKTTMQHSEEIQALEDKHARELMELTEQLNIERVNEIASLNDLREAELKAKDDAIAFIEEECRKHEAAEKALLIQVRENSFDIASLKELLSSRDQDIIRIKEETKKLVHQTEAELALTHQAHVERLNEEHIAECQQMLQEFEQAQQFLKKQVMTQAKQLQEADLRYINREPREVDLTRIAELEDDVKRRKRKIAALMEEVEFFKLELNNREANFNRIFNKTPIVGLIEPLKFVGTQKKRDGRPDMSQRLPPLQASVPPAAITNPSSTPPLVAPAASPAPTQKRPRSGAVYPTITAVPLASEL